MTPEQTQQYLAYHELVRSACPQRDIEAQARGEGWSAGDEEFLLGVTLDLSEWEGISFWARRSIDSQPGIRLAVGDQYTDEDVSYLQYHINPASKRNCERKRDCFLKVDSTTTCKNQKPCVPLSFDDIGTTPTDLNPQNCGSQATYRNKCTLGHVCVDPDRELLPPQITCKKENDQWSCHSITNPDGWEPPDFLRCGDDCAPGECIAPDQCPVGHPCSRYGQDEFGRELRYCWNPLVDPVPKDSPEFIVCAGPALPDEAPPGEYPCQFFYKPFQRLDAQFTGRTCHQFAFEGGITESFCYNPGVDPDPAEGLDLCGDHWLSPVRLSTEWQFFTIPFEVLLQQGWAKESHRFDLTSLALVRFTWDRGWIDYWIDDVRFYRRKRR